MAIPRNKGLLPYARQLRREMTAAERQLWYHFLRDYSVKFTRQKIIGNYIADFCCCRAKLIVELDGGQHFEPQNQNSDVKRTKYLETQGFCVLRYSNDQIWKQLPAVCQILTDVWGRGWGRPLSLSCAEPAPLGGELYPSDLDSLREKLKSPAVRQGFVLWK